MDQNVKDFLYVLTALVSLAALILTIRRDGKTDKKERDENRDALSKIRYQLDTLITFNTDRKRIDERNEKRLANHERRLIKLETRVCPDDEIRYDDREGE